MAGNSFVPEPTNNLQFLIYYCTDLSKNFWSYEIVFEHEKAPCEHNMKVNNSGCVITCTDIDTEQEYEWNYSGEGKFLGFSTEQNGEIVYGISDDVYNLDGISILYVVADASLQNTDLTGTKLKFLDVPNLTNGSWQINFKTNNQSFTSFTVEDSTPVETGYLTFETEDGSDFSLGTDYGIADSSWDGTMEYSTDTTSWSTWQPGTTIQSVNGKLYLRGSNNSIVTNYESSGGSN